MTATTRLLEVFGRALLPKRSREPLREYLLKGGYDHIPYPAFGVSFFAMLIITAVLHLRFLRPRLIGETMLFTLLATFIFWVIVLGIIVAIIMFSTWSFLNLKIYSRTKEMEERLPEYLSLVVTNLRSGMSFDKSLWAAIRPEFGVLAKEITLVSKRVMTGNDTSEALTEFAMRYDSPILRRSANLIISEIESGGEVATVIERVITNLRKTQHLKQEMAASVLSYMMFISIIVIVLAPVLFALANTILAVILNLAKDIAAAPGGGGIAGGTEQLFRSMSNLATDGEQLLSDFKMFSWIALGTIAFFSSLIVSIIEKGDIRGGIKYVPLFIGGSLLVFVGADKIVSLMFAGLTG